MPMLDNKVAVVTGGARGIGLAIARRFVAEGAKVVIADIDAARGEASAAELGSGCKFVAADVGEPRDAGKLIAAALAFGGSTCW